MTRDYGTGDGQIDPRLAGTCDTLNSDSVTIRNTSGCQRFVDVFDFTDLLFDEIDYFELTVTYNENRRGGSILGFLFGEHWAVRPAYGVATGEASSNTIPLLSTVAATPITSSYQFTSSMDVFNSIVTNQQFYLWTAQQGTQTHEFNLFSATLSIFGTASASEVSAPGSLALLGLGTALLGLRRRRKLH